ncbi:hypothetical protein ACP4OV_015979 [Aristida adscensionis]
MDATIGDPLLSSSVERAFEVHPMPGFWEQVTLRASLVTVVLSVVFCFVALRIMMTAGIVPALNMPITVLSFYFLKWLVKLMHTCGIAKQSFTRQENLFVVTAITTCINISLSGGFATSVMAMTKAVAESLTDNPDPRDIVDDLPLGRYMLFLLLIGLASIFCVLPFKKALLIDYRLLFPSGAVLAHLINSIHTPQGAYVAKLQVAKLAKSFAASLFWTVFQWFYTAGANCGFSSFPTFGLALFQKRFYFDFSATYVGIGMVCPYMVNLALLLGGTFSWGFFFPYIESKQGDWYTTKSPSSLTGSNGYKVFLGVTLILTDGMFNFLTLLATSFIDFYHKRQEIDSGMANYIMKHPSLSYDDRKRIELFLSQRIPSSIPVAGYIICAIISSIVIPWIFTHIAFYHVAAIYIVVPIFSYCNAYGTGVTDWSAAPTYARFMIFVVAAWVAKPGAIVAGLVGCAITNVTVHVSSQSIQDFKTSFMTMTSNHATLAGQIFGIILGATINPCIFNAFKRSAHAAIGSKTSEYPCPYASMYRAVGIIGMGGVKELPKHCLAICTFAFFLTIAFNSLGLVAQKKGWTIQYYIPSMTAMAVPFFTGAYFPIGMCVGSLVLFVWTKIDSQGAELYSSAVAAGMICGEGIFSLPTALLTMYNVQPPICMKFLASGAEVSEVDSFLSTLGTSAKS